MKWNMFDIESKKAVIISNLSKNLWIVALIMFSLFAVILLKVPAIGTAQTDSAGTYGFENETVVLPDITNDSINETIANETQIINNVNLQGDTAPIEIEPEPEPLPEPLPIQKKENVSINPKIIDANGKPIEAGIEIINPSSKTTMSINSGKESIIDKGAYDIKITPVDFPVKEIYIKSAIIDGNITEFIKLDDPVDNRGYAELYAIDPTALNFTEATVTVTAKGDELWKCKSWNFTEQSCYGSWEKIMDITPGQEYSFTLTADDPGFAEINITAAEHLDENKNFINDIYDEVKELDGTWSEPIYHGEYVRATFESNMTNGNVINLYVRNNQSLNTHIEIYEQNGSVILGSTPIITETGQYNVELGGMYGYNDVFDIKVVNAENDSSAYLEFDYIHDEPGNLQCGSGSSGTCPTAASPCVGSACSYSTCDCVVNASQTIDNATTYTFNSLTINSGVTVSIATSASGGVGAQTTGPPGKNDSINSGGNGGNGGDGYTAGGKGLGGNTSGGGGGGGTYLTTYVGGRGGYFGGGGGAGAGYAAICSGGTGGAGGGTVTFNCSTLIYIVGTLQANATNGANGGTAGSIGCGGAGGGGGGQISLKASNVTISGTVQVNGGNGGDGGAGGNLYPGGGGGGGGGGFINVSYSTVYSVSGTVRALGGSNGLKGYAAGSAADGVNGSVGAIINQTIAPADNPPTSTLVSPPNGNITTSNTVNFTCNATDDINLANITFYWNYSGSFIANGTASVNGTFNQTNFSRTNLNNGAILWNCLACDNASQCSFASANYTVTINVTTPLLSIIYPQNTTYNTNVSALNYTVSDANLQTCWYSTNNGQTNVTITCGTNVTGLTSAEGSNTWSVWANNTAGNRNSSSTTFSKDTIAPTIVIVSPVNTTYNNRTQLVNISSNGNYVWFFNGTGNQTYTIPVNVLFNDGSSTLIAYANDSAGNFNSTSVAFSIDSIKPSINFSSPTETSGTTLTTRNNILVNVTANDTNLANITVNLYNSTRGLVNTTVTTSSPNFINFTSLANGLYYFNSTARDAAGNSNSTETRNATIDTTAPLVNITYPQNTTYNTNVSALNYTIVEANPGSCWYSNNSGIWNSTSVVAGINFTNVISIEGSNTWKVYCNDTAGNTNSSSVTFSKDTIKPIITIYSPQNTTYNNRTILVNFTADNYQSLWFYNGTANETYTTQVYRTFAEGSNTIIAYANDTSGNLNSTSVVFSIDTTPPYIAFISPTNGTLYNTTQVLINITNSSSQAVWWFNETLNQTYNSAVYQNFTDQATHTIYAYANDSAGNVNTTSVIFRINTSITDLTPPTFNTSNTRPQPSSQYNQTNNVILAANPSENSTVTANITWDAASQIVSLIYNRTNWYYNNTFANTIYPGVYVIIINATDTFGNSNTTTTNFTIRDITAPSVTNIQPVAGTNYNQSQNVNITANVTDWYYDSVQAVIARVKYPNGTGVNYTLTEIDDTQIFDNIIFTNITQTGRYNITIIANDTSGNVNNTGTSWFNVNDVAAPQIIILSPASQTYNISSINFSIASNENLSACKFTLNNWLTNYTMSVNASKTGANYTNSSIADGSYTSRFWCNDTSGNANNTEQVSFSKDTAKPLISITYPGNTTYNTDISQLNYTLIEIYTDTCWYSTNNGQANTTITCGQNVTGLTSTEGSNTWTVWANDTSGNTNYSQITFSKDTISPNITSTLISPYDPAVGYNVTLNATAADNLGVSGIFVNITLPNTTVITRTLPMANYTIQVAGRHNITFWANDTGGNIGTSADYFIAGVARVNVQFNIINNNSIGIPVNLTIYFTGTNKEVHEHNFTGSYVDAHTTLLYDLHYQALDGNISVRLNEVNLSLDNNGTLGLDRTTDLTGYLVTYGINNTYNFTNATIVLSYAGTGFTNENYLGLYKCSDWNFVTRTCAGTWTSVTGTQDKTAKTFTLTTTSFSGYAVKQESVPPTPPSPETPSGGAGGGAAERFDVSIKGNCTGSYVDIRVTKQGNASVYLSNVQILIYDSNASALLTNKDGIARFKPSVAGNYTFEFRKIGYVTKKVSHMIYECVPSEEKKPIIEYIPEVIEKAKQRPWTTLMIVLSIVFLVFVIIKILKMRKGEREFHHKFVKIRRWEDGMLKRKHS